MLSDLNAPTEVTEVDYTSKTQVVLDSLVKDESADSYFMAQLSDLKATISLPRTEFLNYRFIDDIARYYYGDSSYWSVLCYYNNILDPLNFKEELGYDRELKIPDKTDIDLIVTAIVKASS